MFHQTFQKLVPGMTPQDVESLVGIPDEIDDSPIPEGSGFGLQDAFEYKIAPGEPALQWTYWDGEQDHAVWFAKPVDRWLLTLRLSAPRGVICDRNRS